MMIKQAEVHRETLEKEFTSGLERIRAEHEKAIIEQRRFREEIARSCTPDDVRPYKGLEIIREWPL